LQLQLDGRPLQVLAVYQHEEKPYSGWHWEANRLILQITGEAAARPDFVGFLVSN
jgi:hypothetical protein